MLMVGVTLSLGSAVVAAAIGSMGQAQSSASLGSSLQESGSEVQVSLVYATATAGSCPAYQGTSEGTSLTLALFDYGHASFIPTGIVVNSTAYGGSFPSVGPGAMVQISLGVGSCTHPSGQTVVAVDAKGEEVQFET